MNVYDKILEKTGLTLEDLDKPGYAGERETLENWAKQLSTSELTVAEIRDNVEAMLYSVQLELVSEPEFIPSTILPFIKVHNPKNIYLKARMHNYMILNAFLASPTRNKKAIERAINGIKLSKSK